MKKSMMLTDFALACALCALAVFSAFLPFDADAPRWWRVVAHDHLGGYRTVVLPPVRGAEDVSAAASLRCGLPVLDRNFYFDLYAARQRAGPDLVYAVCAAVGCAPVGSVCRPIPAGCWHKVPARRRPGAAPGIYSGSGLRRLLPVSYPHLGRAGRCIYVLYQFAVPGACGRVLAPGADGSAADVSGPQPSATAKRFYGLFEKIYSAYRQ